MEIEGISFKKVIIMNVFTGICVCGHPWDEHHHSVPLNKEWRSDPENQFLIVEGVVGEECQYSNYKGQPCHEDEPRCRCANYWDKGWMIKEENLGTQKLKEILKDVEEMSVEDYNKLFDKVKMQDLDPEISEMVNKDFKNLLL